MFNEPGGYSSNVGMGILPGFQSFRPSDAFYGPYYDYMGTQNTNAAQERIADRSIGAQQSTLQTLAPALFRVLGSFGGGGGGGYQTDYGAGLRPPQGQQQTFRGYAQPQQQQPMQRMGGMPGGMQGGGLQQLMQLLARFGGG